MEQRSLLALSLILYRGLGEGGGGGAVEEGEWVKGGEGLGGGGEGSGGGGEDP